MSFGEITYIIALLIFVYLTFGFIRNYYKSKFDDEGHRMDMKDDNNLD